MASLLFVAYLLQSLYCGYLIWDKYVKYHVFDVSPASLFCSFWISLFSFLSASLFDFCLGYLLRSLRLYLFIFFLNSSEIHGSLVPYLIVLVGIFFEIDIFILSLNIFHILSISCESCDWFIL